jgi:uncharacterized protein (TIGR04255 family)
MDLMGRRYKQSPIIEAISEFQFDPDASWDLTIPGLIYEKLQKTFPERNQVTQINTAIAGNVGSVHVDTVPLMQFIRENKSALVQVGQNLLTVNQLKPYTSWQDFLPLIEEGFQAYKAVAHPSQLSRIALRYINRIEFEQKTELEDYFHFRPFLGQGLPQNLSAFLIGVVAPDNDSKNNTSIQLGSADATALNYMAILLDIHYYHTSPKELALEDIPGWMEAAHNKIEDIFEACITDRLRQQFEEI